MVPGKVMSGDLTEGMKAKTVQGGEVTITLDGGAKVNGAAQVRATGAGRRVNFTAEADIARLLPAHVAPLLEGGLNSREPPPSTRRGASPSRA